MGLRWTASERLALERAFKEGDGIKTAMQTINRSREGIRRQAVILGYIESADDCVERAKRPSLSKWWREQVETNKALRWPAP